MITIPKWVATATKDEVVAMAAKLADRLFGLRIEADADGDCARKGACLACRPDPENCALRRASAALIEWDDGPSSAASIRALFRPEGDSATYEATIRGIEFDLGWEDEEGAGGVTDWWLGYSYPDGREDGEFVDGDVDEPDWANVARVVTKVAGL